MVKKDVKLVDMVNEKEREEGIFRVRVTGGDVELKPALCGNRFSLKLN